MKKTTIQRLFSLVLALVLCGGLFVPLQAATTETKYGVAQELATGVYSIVVPSVTPTGMAAGPYYIDHATAVNPGFLFKSFDKNNPNGAAVWKITKISDTQCTIQNESKGAQGYINMGADTIGYGPEQKLNYEFSAGKVKFFVTVGGQNWYIRFTNSNRNESRFQSGTGTASHEFELYGNITEVKEEAAPELEIPPVTGDPIFTIACISDLHTDYGLEQKAPYIRGSILTTVDAIAAEEDADILLVGGDNTSDNGKTGGWPYETFMNVIDQYRDVSKVATESGRSLWACGNHDYQAGVAERYDSYAAYEDIMRETCGEPLSVIRQKDDKSLGQQFPEFLMGAHYNIEGFDFIILNAPYAGHQTYSSVALTWLNERLRTIGSNKTTFLLTHYPLTDSNNISTPSYGVSGDSYNRLTQILKKYPNVIYLYGHNHGNGESVYIADDTFERITSYTKTMRPVKDRNVVPTSFITSFMGSMSYYKCSFNTAWLDHNDPKVIQALMIYVYEDRIVFQMKNYGESLSDVTPRSWTVMRDVKTSLAEPPASATTPGTDPGSSGDKTEDKKDEISEITKEILVTTDLRKDIIYDSSRSVLNYSFQGKEEFKSFGSSLIGSGIPEKATLSVKNLSSGESYDALSKALEPVVKEFAAYSYTLNHNGDPFMPEGFVKITTKLKENLFGPETDELDLGVYYLNKDGKLVMTDVMRNEDGTISFLLPQLTDFAISARANVEDSAKDSIIASHYEPTGVILALVGGGIALIGLTVLVLILVRMWKKEHGTKYKDE